MKRPSSGNPVLGADIGATNARFAIAEAGSAAARILFQRTYATADHPGLGSAVRAFLAEAKATHGNALAPGRAAIAVAGPVEGDSARLPNRPDWQIDRRALKKSLGIDIVLLNDFRALAYGVLQGSPADWIELQPGRPVPQANMALVGAGTGLGVSALIWDGERHQPIATEAGHIAFAPQDDLQLALLRHLRERHGRVSTERVVSGKGIPAIYEFLRLQDPADPSPQLKDAAAITALALADPASTAARALDLFIACYGAFAGDIALAFLARGGLYVCGGIAAKLAPRFVQRDFIAAFGAKGRHDSLATSIPVRLVNNEKLGLLGAIHAASVSPW
ncbi:MAG: glucokinase [Proteobacteria bacterium]|nr:glucokinase [Pseudomonadota bacterium]